MLKTSKKLYNNVIVYTWPNSGKDFRKAWESSSWQQNLWPQSHHPLCSMLQSPKGNDDLFLVVVSTTAVIVT